MNKKYWLRGLVAGSIVYALFLLSTYLFLGLIGGGEGTGFVFGFIVYYSLPAIPLGLLFGWLYGKISKKGVVIISIVVFVLLTSLEVMIVKNAVTPGNNLVFQSINSVEQNVTLAQCESVKNIIFNWPEEIKNAKGSCYERLATANKDISLCEKISDTSFYKTSCRYNVSVAKQDLSLCDTLPNERSNFSKYACYSAIGSNKHDEEICNMIPVDSPGGDRSVCIEAVARFKGDCDILPGSGKDYCYLYQSESARVYARDNRCDVYKEAKPFKLCNDYVNGKITVAEDCDRISNISLRQECANYNVNSTQVNYSNQVN